MDKAPGVDGRGSYPCVQRRVRPPPPPQRAATALPARRSTSAPSLQVPCTRQGLRRGYTHAQHARSHRPERQLAFPSRQLASGLTLDPTAVRPLPVRSYNRRKLYDLLPTNQSEELLVRLHNQLHPPCVKPPEPRVPEARPAAAAASAVADLTHDVPWKQRVSPWFVASGRTAAEP